MKRIRKLFCNTTRGSVGLCVAVAICAMFLPLPMDVGPSGTVEKEASQAFPCQHRACGCRSADQCWKKCCCFTNQQKVAWANANKVAVPEFVLAAARRESAARTSAKVVVKSCCSPKLHVRGAATPSVKGSSAIVLKLKPDVAKSAHECKSSVTTDHVGGTANGGRGSSQLKWVLVVKMAECQGMNSCWFCLPPTILPEPPGVREVDASVPESIVVQSERLQMSAQKPPLPPPRLV